MSSGYFQDRIKSPTNGHSPATSPGLGQIRTPAAPKISALQGRITEVLSGSYADLDIRDALETLDARGVRNDTETRRNLRLDVQQELIQCNGEIVRDFGQVAEQLKRVGAAINNLNKSCAVIRAHVVAAKRETGPILEETSSMITQKRQTETKNKLLNAFTTHFLLSDAELTVLTSTAEPVTDEFFAALARAKQIHQDSQVLLGSEDQQLGLEIMEQSSKHLNAAFQKLFRWTQRELKTIDLENPQLSIAVRRALRVLAERPQLFQSCLDFFADSREHTLSDAFYAALTGAPTSAGAVAVPSRAIELNAHDPLRYVSDMLAWVHAATVGEREALQILFVSDADEISKSLKAGLESQPWLQEPGEAAPASFDGKQALNDLVDRDLSGVVRQLRQRIEQIVHSHEQASLAYQISNLVSFYTSIFGSLIGSESTMEQTLRPVISTAMDQFKNITRDHIANLQSDVNTAPADLGPPDFLIEALESLKGLMKSYDTSFATATTSEERMVGFQPVMAESLDPYLDGCANMAKRMNPPDSQIYAINCLSATKAVIKGPSYTAERVEDIDETLDEQETHLISFVQSWLAMESGMDHLLRSLRSHYQARTSEDMQKVGKLPALKPEVLAGTAQQLDAFLPTAMEDARGFVGRLRDRAVARRICEQAADLFAEEFEVVERLLAEVDDVRGVKARGSESGSEEDRDGPVSLRDIFPRTSDEIKVLLS